MDSSPAVGQDSLLRDQVELGQDASLRNKASGSVVPSGQDMSLKMGQENRPRVPEMGRENRPHVPTRVPPVSH